MKSSFPSSVVTISFSLLSVLQTEHPFKSKKMVWHKLLSKQRRRAVVACFRMTPLYNIPRWETPQYGGVTPTSSVTEPDKIIQTLGCCFNCRHRASNMFLEGYKRNWIHTEGCSFEDRMIDDLSVRGRGGSCTKC